MSEAFTVEWADHALAAWRALPFAEAEVVAKAVDRFATTGEGMTIAQGPHEFVLFVHVYAIIMFDDPATGVLHIDAIRHA